MKKILAVMFVALIMTVAVIPAVDADNPYQVTVRWSDTTIWHATVVCEYEATFDEQNIWAYAVGGDTPMINFLSNYRTASPPVSQITQFKEGEYYEIYYISGYQIPWFVSIVNGPYQVLGPYTYDFYVNEKSQMTITLDEILTKNVRYIGIYDVIGLEKEHFTSLGVGTSATLGYAGEGHYYSITSTYKQDYLYIEAKVTMNVKTFTGSPGLYIGLSTAVVVLVGVTMFICGRKPKL